MCRPYGYKQDEQRFVYTDKEVPDFIAEQEPINTVRKTKYYLNLFQLFLAPGLREIWEIFWT